MDSPPIKQLTFGPKRHWFGYYDKLQIDSENRRILSMAVDFEHRPPNPNEEIEIGFVDLLNNHKWTTLGTTTSWNWQQGCMLQWVPGSTSKIIWNERGDDGYRCRVLTSKPMTLIHFLGPFMPLLRMAVGESPQISDG